MLPLQIQLIEVLAGAPQWFINTAAQVSALTTAGGNILLCTTKLRWVFVESFVDNIVYSLNAFGWLLSLKNDKKNTLILSFFLIFIIVY